MEQPFIDWAEKQLGEKPVETKEAHGDQSEGFHLVISTGSYFLKIAPSLVEERKKIDWLAEKLPVPKIVGFTRIGEKDAILMTSIEGLNLAKLRRQWPIEKVIDKLAEALLKFHAVDASDCPFGEAGADKVLVHGDACLPNFIFKDEVLSGYIDLGDMRVDYKEADLCAAIWSLQFNLGAGYGIKFLERYGVENVTEEMVEKLRLQYEDVMEKWGLK